MSPAIPPGTIKASFEDLALRWPDRPALLGQGGQELSFSQLWSRLRSLIVSLEENNVPEGGIIVVSLTDPFANIVALIAAICHGIALPLPVFESSAEFRRLGEELPIDAVILDGKPASPQHPLAAAGALPLIFDRDRVSPVPGLDAGARRSRSGGNDFTRPGDCLLIRTGGTLSAPKLVALSQESLVLSARSFANWLEIGEKDRSLCVMPQYHLHALHRSILPFLFSGASVVCVEGPDRRYFVDWLRQFEPTAMTATPTIFKHLLEVATIQGLHENSLRVLASGSDTLSAQLLNSLQRHFGVPVLQFYGLTEAAPSLTTTDQKTPPDSVGHPVPPWQIAFAQDGFVDLTRSEGEIAVRGGILNDVIVDGNRLTPGLSSDGWLLTGDLGRRSQDGALFLLGRETDIINKAGVKIDPALVEAAAKSLPGVADCVCFGAGGDDIRNILLVSGPGELNSAQVRQKLQDELPLYALPDKVHVVAEVPRTATSKLSRQHVAKQFLAGELAFEDGPTGSAADNVVHEASAPIRKMFRDLIEIDGFDDNASFFDLGGDSFLALQLILDIEEVFGCRLSPNALLSNPSVAALSRLLDDGPDGKLDGSRPKDGSLVCLNDEGRKTPVFLAPSLSLMPPYSRVLKKAFADVGHPLYSFDLRSESDAEQPIRSLQQIAAACVEAIRSHWPEGPYVVCGFSFGAHVAFEIARQLLKGGSEISALVLLDDHADFHKSRVKLGTLKKREHEVATKARSRLLLAANYHGAFGGPIHLVRARDAYGSYRGSIANDWEWLTKHHVTVLDVQCDHADLMRGSFPGLWASWMAQLVSKESDGTQKYSVTRLQGTYSAFVDCVLSAQNAAIQGDQKRCANLTEQAYKGINQPPVWLIAMLLETRFNAGNYFAALVTFKRHWKRSAEPSFLALEFVKLFGTQRFERVIRSKNVRFRALLVVLVKATINEISKYAIETETSDPGFLFQLSLLAQRCHIEGTALKRAEQAYKLAPAAKMYQRRANCLAILGKTDEALTVLREAVERYPTSVMAKRELAKILVTIEGWSSELKNCLDQARAEDIEIAEFVLRLVELAIKNGHADCVPNLLEYLQGARELHTKHQQRLASLKEMCADCQIAS